MRRSERSCGRNDVRRDEVHVQPLVASRLYATRRTCSGSPPLGSGKSGKGETTDRDELLTAGQASHHGQIHHPRLTSSCRENGSDNPGRRPLFGTKNPPDCAETRDHWYRVGACCEMSTPRGY